MKWRWLLYSHVFNLPVKYTTFSPANCFNFRLKGITIIPANVTFFHAVRQLSFNWKLSQLPFRTDRIFPSFGVLFSREQNLKSYSSKPCVNYSVFSLLTQCYGACWITGWRCHRRCRGGNYNQYNSYQT